MPNKKNNEQNNLDFWEKAGDKLGRRETARYLTNFFDARFRAKPNEPGYVLAVNAEWGLGKTFLLETWAKELQSLDYPAVYFDAWKNDFTTDPLIAFIAQIDTELSKQFSKSKVITPWRAALGAMEKFVKPAAKVVASVAAKRLASLTVEELKLLFEGSDSHAAWSKEVSSPKIG